MNCRDANEILERMIFEEVRADAGLRKHIDTCTACSQVYRDTLKARELMEMVRRSEPVPRNPGEITDNIMSAILKCPQKTPVVWLLFQRLLAAASVALFLLFGYEQYNVVKKVSALEMQFTVINADSRYSGPLRLASTFDISKAGVSFSEIERLLSAGNGDASRCFSYNNKQSVQRNKK